MKNYYFESGQSKQAKNGAENDSQLQRGQMKIFQQQSKPLEQINGDLAIDYYNGGYIHQNTNRQTSSPILLQNNQFSQRESVFNTNDISQYGFVTGRSNKLEKIKKVTKLKKSKSNNIKKSKSISKKQENDNKLNIQIQKLLNTQIPQLPTLSNKKLSLDAELLISTPIPQLPGPGQALKILKSQQNGILPKTKSIKSIIDEYQSNFKVKEPKKKKNLFAVNTENTNALVNDQVTNETEMKSEYYESARSTRRDQQRNQIRVRSNSSFSGGRTRLIKSRQISEERKKQESSIVRESQTISFKEENRLQYESGQNPINFYGDSDIIKSIIVTEKSISEIKNKESVLGNNCNFSFPLPEFNETDISRVNETLINNEIITSPDKQNKNKAKIQSEVEIQIEAETLQKNSNINNQKQQLNIDQSIIVQILDQIYNESINMFLNYYEIPSQNAITITKIQFEFKGNEIIQFQFHNNQALNKQIEIEISDSEKNQQQTEIIEINQNFLKELISQYSIIEPQQFQTDNKKNQQQEMINKIMQDQYKEEQSSKCSIINHKYLKIKDQFENYQNKLINQLSTIKDKENIKEVKKEEKLIKVFTLEEICFDQISGKEIILSQKVLKQITNYSQKMSFKQRTIKNGEKKKSLILFANHIQYKIKFIQWCSQNKKQNIKKQKQIQLEQSPSKQNKIRMMRKKAITTDQIQKIIIDQGHKTINSQEVLEKVKSHILNKNQQKNASSFQQDYSINPPSSSLLRQVALQKSVRRKSSIDGDKLSQQQSSEGDHQGQRQDSVVDTFGNMQRLSLLNSNPMLIKSLRLSQKSNKEKSKESNKSCSIQGSETSSIDTDSEITNSSLFGSELSAKNFDISMQEEQESDLDDIDKQFGAFDTNCFGRLKSLHEDVEEYNSSCQESELNDNQELSLVFIQDSIMQLMKNLISQSKNLQIPLIIITQDNFYNLEVNKRNQKQWKTPRPKEIKKIKHSCQFYNLDEQISALNISTSNNIIYLTQYRNHYIKVTPSIDKKLLLLKKSRFELLIQQQQLKDKNEQLFDFKGEKGNTMQTLIKNSMKLKNDQNQQRVKDAKQVIIQFLKLYNIQQQTVFNSESFTIDKITSTNQTGTPKIGNLLANLQLLIKQQSITDPFILKKQKLKDLQMKLLSNINELEKNFDMPHIIEKIINVSEFIDNKYILVYKYTLIKNARFFKFLKPNHMIYKIDLKVFCMRSEYHEVILSTFLNRYETYCELTLWQQKFVNRQRDEREAKYKIKQTENNNILNLGEITFFLLKDILKKNQIQNRHHIEEMILRKPNCFILNRQYPQYKKCDNFLLQKLFECYSTVLKTENEKLMNKNVQIDPNLICSLYGLKKGYQIGGLLAQQVQDENENEFSEYIDLNTKGQIEFESLFIKKVNIRLEKERIEMEDLQIELELKNDDKMNLSIVFHNRMLFLQYAKRYTIVDFYNKKDQSYPLFQLSNKFGYREKFYRDGLMNVIECLEIQKPVIMKQRNAYRKRKQTIVIIEDDLVYNNDFIYKEDQYGQTITIPKNLNKPTKKLRKDSKRVKEDLEVIDETSVDLISSLTLERPFQKKHDVNLTIQVPNLHQQQIQQSFSNYLVNLSKQKNVSPQKVENTPGTHISSRKSGSNNLHMHFGRDDYIMGIYDFESICSVDKRPPKFRNYSHHILNIQAKERLIRKINLQTDHDINKTKCDLEIEKNKQNMRITVNIQRRSLSQCIKTIKLPSLLENDIISFKNEEPAVQQIKKISRGKTMQTLKKQLSKEPYTWTPTPTQLLKKTKNSGIILQNKKQDKHILRTIFSDEENISNYSQSSNYKENVGRVSCVSEINRIDILNLEEKMDVCSDYQSSQSSTIQIDDKFCCKTEKLIQQNYIQKKEQDKVIEKVCKVIETQIPILPSQQEIDLQLHQKRNVELLRKKLQKTEQIGQVLKNRKIKFKKDQHQVEIQKAEDQVYNETLFRMDMTPERYNYIKDCIIQNRSTETIEQFYLKFRHLIDHQNEDGETFLAFAVLIQRAQIVKIYLKLNANTDLANFTEKNTPLHLAVIVGNKNIINMLLAYGANEKLLNIYGCLAWEGINSNYELEKRYGPKLKNKKSKFLNYKFELI